MRVAKKAGDRSASKWREKTCEEDSQARILCTGIYCAVGGNRNRRGADTGAEASGGRRQAARTLEVSRQVNHQVNRAKKK